MSSDFAGTPGLRGYLDGVAPVLRTRMICREDSSTGRLKDSTLCSSARRLLEAALGFLQFLRRIAPLHGSEDAVLAGEWQTEFIQKR